MAPLARDGTTCIVPETVADASFVDLVCAMPADVTRPFAQDAVRLRRQE